MKADRDGGKLGNVTGILVMLQISTNSQNPEILLNIGEMVVL